MEIDFSKLTTGSVADTSTEPSQIFAALPNNRYPYLRDVQGQVLERWYGRRDEQDVVVKMNTGAGKTVVGLLILKSCLNSSIGPAVYLAADPYLAEQVVEEAARLGVETTTEPNSHRFTSGRAVLATSVYRLINGRSVFGVGSQIHRKVGAVLVDDAHARSAVAEEQFSIRLSKGHEGWSRLFDLFEHDLRIQAVATALEIKDGDPSSVSCSNGVWKSS
jgi:superfamily II DNA or RNA helicase